MISENGCESNLFFSLLPGPGTENYTKNVQVEEALLKLRKIICFITAEHTGSYNKTTREGDVLVLRTILHYVNDY